MSKPAKPLRDLTTSLLEASGFDGIAIAARTCEKAERCNCCFSHEALAVVSNGSKDRTA